MVRALLLIVTLTVLSPTVARADASIAPPGAAAWAPGCVERLQTLRATLGPARSDVGPVVVDGRLSWRRLLASGAVLEVTLARGTGRATSGWSGADDGSVAVYARYPGDGCFASVRASASDDATRARWVSGVTRALDECLPPPAR